MVGCCAATAMTPGTKVGDVVDTAQSPVLVVTSFGMLISAQITQSQYVYICARPLREERQRLSNVTSVSFHKEAV
jgi:hypothetical protein